MFPLQFPFGEGKPREDANIAVSFYNLSRLPKQGAYTSQGAVGLGLAVISGVTLAGPVNYSARPLLLVKRRFRLNKQSDPEAFISSAEVRWAGCPGSDVVWAAPLHCHCSRSRIVPSPVTCTGALAFPVQTPPLHPTMCLHFNTCAHTFNIILALVFNF